MDINLPEVRFVSFAFRFNREIIDIVIKKLYITFCLLLVSLCIHAQMISGIIVDEKNSH